MPSPSGHQPATRDRGFGNILAQLGPGAIVASLTIGSGELIFSTRGGALFGYRVLGLFVLVLLLKWGLVLASARHWITTGRHPFERWIDLPGPRGWLLFSFFLLAAMAFPVWASFHASTVGTLLASLTGTTQSLRGGGSLAWGIIVLVATMILVFTGSFTRMEKLQTAIVALMLLSMLASLMLLNPSWTDMIRGVFYLGPLRYPDWARVLPEFAGRPVWLEAATYAGVLGGGGYDYLAYITWLREKHANTLARAQSDPAARLWLQRVVLVDITVSFFAVLLFTGAFVACGVILLGPQHQVPSGTDLLTLQAQFVSAGGGWLRPLYFAGALLAIGGTLYGTIEVAPATLNELLRAFRWTQFPAGDPRARAWAVRWCSLGALALLIVSLLQRIFAPTTEPLRLVAFLTPANLFTGVMACGIVCLLNLWTNWRFSKRGQRMNPMLVILNLAGAALFLGLGLKGYWDLSAWRGLAILAGTLGLGMIFARMFKPRVDGRDLVDS
ncbi:MAG: hypothetical protein EXS31_06915 [Pedosphaera sp.]|nr:hypothetical protein [Pedosphaera sp.]